MKQLKSGAKITSKTIAALGNRNRPIDMVVYEKAGKEFLLMANGRRGVMKIDVAQIEGAPRIEAKVRGKEGVTYDTIEAWKGIDQLDLFGDAHALILRSDGEDAKALESLALP